MNRIALLAVTLFIASGPGAAGMYKCDDPNTGKPIFSQTPCSPDAEVVDLKYHRPTPEQIRQHQTQVESERRFIEESSARRKAAQEATKSPTVTERQIPQTVTEPQSPKTVTEPQSPKMPPSTAEKPADS